MYVFTPKRGCPICHVLLTVQNMHRRALLFIDNRQFIGFLHKHLHLHNAARALSSPSRCFQLSTNLDQVCLVVFCAEMLEQFSPTSNGY